MHVYFVCNFVEGVPSICEPLTDHVILTFTVG